MNILITGGCGFLGQYLTKEIITEFPKANITLLDLKINQNGLFDLTKTTTTTTNNNNNNESKSNAIRKNKRQHNKINKQIQYKIGRNICDYDSIKDDFKNINVVFHLAGIVAFGIKDRERLFKVNLEGTKNVFQAAKHQKVKHFIHVSSVAALGYNNKKIINETYKFNWNIAKKYNKFYMISKHRADKFLEFQKGFQQIPLMKISIAYPGLMLGPGDYNNSVNLLSALLKKQIPFNPPGGTNIIDVRDVAKGLVEILKKDKRGDDFLLSGENLTFVKQNNIISKVLGVSPPKATLPHFLQKILYQILLIAEKKNKKKPRLTADNIHSSFQFRYFDNQKAKDNLNWKPIISFEQTIKDTFCWMKKEKVIK